MEEVFLLYSDLHFEKKDKEVPLYFIKSVNEKIAEIKKQYKTPIVLLAGDIDNGYQAYDYLGKIEAQVIYIAGNHEFWYNDYSFIKEKLISKSPKNVIFLHNNLHITDEHIILGSTLWTDVGLYSNENLTTFATNFMNDNVKITNNNWYSQENINILKKNLNNEKESVKFIENKMWNIWCERQEYINSIKFLLIFNEFYDFYINYIEDFINEKFIDKTKDLKNIKLKNILENQEFINYYEKLEENNLKYINYNNYINSEYCNIIFNKFKYYNIKSKKIVLMTHHSAFLEELFICYNENTNPNLKIDFLNQRNLINELNENTNLLNNNYFTNNIYNENNVDYSLIKIIHYFGNGSKTLPENLINKISLYVHGHNHYLNYTDYLKSMKISTNPCGTFISNVQDINNNYNLIHKVIKTYRNKNLLNEKINFWTLNLFDKFSYEQFLSEIQQTIKIIEKNLILFLYDNSMINNINNFITFKSNLLSLKSLIEEITNMEQLLIKGFLVRSNVKINFSNLCFNNFLDKKNILFNNKINYIFDKLDKWHSLSMDNDNLIKILENILNISNIVINKQNKIKKINEFMNNKKWENVFSITDNDIINFLDLINTNNLNSTDSTQNNEILDSKIMIEKIKKDMEVMKNKK